MQTSDTLGMILSVLEVSAKRRYIHVPIYIQISSIQTLMFSILGLRQYMKKWAALCTYMYLHRSPASKRGEFEGDGRVES